MLNMNAIKWYIWNSSCWLPTDISGLFVGKGARMYHCQFFGPEAERGWVSETATIKFEGRDAFLQFVKKTIDSAGTKAQRKQACQKYEVRQYNCDVSPSSVTEDLTMQFCIIHDILGSYVVVGLCHMEPTTAYKANDTTWEMIVWWLKGSWHGRKWLHLFSDSEAYHEQMSLIPSSNETLNIALSNART